MFVLALFTGYLIADLASGLVHWFCDSYLAEDTPLIGPLLIHPFREHHRDPLGITRHGFLELNGNNCLAMIPLLAWATQFQAPLDSGLALFLQASLLALALAILGTNQFHRWAHDRSSGALVEWLQRHRLILSPEQHRSHHRNHSRCFCITCGWMNGFFDDVLARFANE